MLLHGSENSTPLICSKSPCTCTPCYRLILHAIGYVLNYWPIGYVLYTIGYMYSMLQDTLDSGFVFQKHRKVVSEQTEDLMSASKCIMRQVVEM